MKRHTSIETILTILCALLLLYQQNCMRVIIKETLIKSSARIAYNFFRQIV